MSKITDSAKGEECQVRIPNVCNGNPETVVFAHIGGGGMGMKQPDTEGAYCCSSCHDALDGRAGITRFTDSQFGYLMEKLKLYHHEGAMRTRAILIRKGLITLK